MNNTDLFLNPSYEQGKGFQIVIKWLGVMHLL